METQMDLVFFVVFGLWSVISVPLLLHLNNELKRFRKKEEGDVKELVALEGAMFALKSELVTTIISLFKTRRFVPEGKEKELRRTLEQFNSVIAAIRRSLVNQLIALILNGQFTEAEVTQKLDSEPGLREDVSQKLWNERGRRGGER